jgi:hypothetical protein
VRDSKMKKALIISLMLVFIFALFTASVSAAAKITIVEADSNSKIVIYDDDGNSELDRRKLENDISLERTLKITSNETVNNVVISVSNINADFLANVSNGTDSGSSVTIDKINAGEFKTITFTGTLSGAPDSSSGSYAYSGSGENSMGTITIDSDETSLESYSAVFVNQNLLEIYKEKITVYVDGDSESVEDGDSIEDVKPGSKVVVEITLKNNIDSDVRNDKIEDINMNIIAESMDDGDDYEEDDEISSISGEDKDMLTFEFTVPEDIEADEYDVLLTNIEGTDEFGNKHKVEYFTFSLEIERERNKVEIKTARFNFEQIACGKTTAQLFVKIQNTGERDQDDVAIKIEQSKLGIATWDRTITEDDDLVSIEEDEDDSEYEKTYTLQIPEDATPGTYFVTVSAFFDENILSDSDDLTLEIMECPKEVEEENKTPVISTPDETVIEIKPETTSPEKVETNDETKQEETTQTSELNQKNMLYNSLLILGNVALLVIIAGLVFKFFIRKN